MKNRILALLTAFLLLFTITACRDSSSGGSSLFTLNLADNPYNLDPQLSTDAASEEIIKNTFRMLMKIDKDGNITPDACSDYTLSEDGLTYTFTIRENIFWQSQREFEAPLTANDFVFAFHRIFDSSTHSPHKEQFSAIVNAREISEFGRSFTTIGVRATDEMTLEIKLAYPCWNFLELLSNTAAAPCNEEFFNLTKGRYGLDPENDASCGAFYVSDHNFDPYWNENYIVLSRNEKNSEFDRVYPKTVTYEIKPTEENETDFKANDIDFLLSDEYTATMKSAGAEAFLTKSVVIRANADFSEQYPELFKSLAYSAFSFEPTEKQIPQYFSRAKGIIPPAVTLMGRSYRSLVSDDTFRPEEKGSVGDEYYGDLRLTVRADAPYSDLCFALSDYWRETVGVNIFVEAVSDTEYETIKAAGFDLLVDEITSDKNSPESYLYYGETSENDISRIKNASSISFAAQFTEMSEKDVINSGGVIPLLYGSEFFAAKSGIVGAEYLPFEKIILLQEARRE
jgi:oligopeptide transport system substrate-binding protein